MPERTYYRDVPADALAEAGVAEAMIAVNPDNTFWRSAKLVVRASFDNSTGKEVPMHQIEAGGVSHRAELEDDGTYSVSSGAANRARLTVEQSEILAALALQSRGLGIEDIDTY